MKKYKSFLDEVQLKRIKSDIPRAQIKSAKDAADYIKQFFFDDMEIFESFFLIILNRSNNTMGYAKISQGGISGTVVDVRIIVKYCIDILGSSAIVGHNHPSGNLRPSKADNDITIKLKEALNYFDIKLLDSLILTTDNYFSFADEGHL